MCNKESQVNGNIVKSSIITCRRKDLKEPSKWDDWNLNYIMLLLIYDKEPHVEGKGNIVKLPMVTDGRKDLKEPGKWQYWKYYYVLLIITY